jgi:predicted dehydrogenase
MIELAIIGAGNVGTRHLQALAKLRRPSRVIVVDPSPAALALAATRFAEMPSGVTTMSYAQSLGAIDWRLDVAIVSTNADVRAQVVRELLSQTSVGALLLEKVLFTKPSDYSEIGRLLEKREVKAWVNCARRAWPFYRDLKERLKSGMIREVNVSGTDWGLGCNSIHMLDIGAWLSGSKGYAITTVNLDNDTRPSKRPGFIELTGAFSGVFKDGPVFHIAAWPARDGAGMPFMLQIIADDLVCIIREEERFAWIADKRSGWKWQEIPCDIVLQSDLTHLVVEEILDRNTAPLTVYEEAAALHGPMLAAFMNHLQARDAKTVILSCPIT